MLRNLSGAQIPKKKLIICAAAVLTAIAVVLAIRPLGHKMLASYREEQALVNMLRLCGAELESVNVTGWARVTGRDEIDLEELVNQTAGSLKLAGYSQTMEKWENPYARGVKVQGTMPGGGAATVLGQTMEITQGQKVTHLMISLGTEAGKAGYYKERLRGALAARSNDGHVALTCTGKIGTALDPEQLLAKAGEVMAGASATIQESTVKDNLVSLTGYSPGLPDSLVYDGKQVNLNVALRSNAQEQATYVYVASPVIYTEY